jgi:hypothetical protein
VGPGHLSDRAVLQYDGVDQVTSELHAHTPHGRVRDVSRQVSDMC